VRSGSHLVARTTHFFAASKRLTISLFSGAAFFLMAAGKMDLPVFGGDFGFRPD
jgi:hypothetical protein